MAKAGYWYDQMSGNKPQATSAGKPDIEALANAVIRGEYGNGDQRRAHLGGLYDAVQRRVNEKLGARSTPTAPNIDALADAAIRGEYGNGATRQAHLGNLYNQVQARVNQIRAQVHSL